jgi:hypothetical protein
MSKDSLAAQKNLDAEPPELLRELGLTIEEVAALQRQGSVVPRQRGRSSTVFELRFRIDGRQRRRYLGSSASRARAVEGALHAWRQGRDELRQLQAAEQAAGRHLRASRQRLQPLLAAAGYAFHGRVLRRTRYRAATTLISTDLVRVVPLSPLSKEN